ncbi:MAG: ferric reductase-like transmembrane domain-containing protein [Candidatus Moraniibacteriota bacterium]|nr:MAG: ferric reductase-like transmembrane domain-containing protein [Candidatus Moranbacteria bacterium]
MEQYIQKILLPIGISPKIKKVLDILSYGVIPLGGLFLSIFFPSVDVFGTFGQIAQIGLLIILFMKPIAFIVPLQFLKRALTYRRQLGVAVFWFSLFHGIGFIYQYRLLNPSDFFGFTNHLLYAGIALLMMIVLGLTSNDVSIKFFQKNWKRIQYLAYPTLFLVLIHSSMWEGEMMKVYVLGGLFLILKYLQMKRFRLDAYIPLIQKWKF